VSARRRPSRAIGVATVAAALAAGAGVAWTIAGDRSAAHAALDQPSVQPVATRAATAAAEPSSSPTLSPSPSPTFDLGAHSATDPASPWVVANKAHQLDPESYAPDDLVPFDGEKLRSAVAKDLRAMFDAATADGVDLTMHSGYRSYGFQQTIFENMVSTYGRDRAERYSARPGHSEHQTGLAVDVGGGSTPSCDMQECFAQTPEGRWLAKHVAEHGFLVRYTAANKATTGYSPEPWHLRWVGRDLTAYMAEHDVTTLEEVFDVSGGAEYR
jgi:zinc D-Ala-D-Ala carboxypeptidase